MSDDTKRPEEQSKNRIPSELKEFVDLAPAYAASFSVEAVAAAKRLNDSESQVVIESLVQPFEEQVKKICDFAIISCNKLPEAQLPEFTEMLRYNSGVTLIKTSTSAMQKGLRAGLGGRFLKWLSNWFKEFKKILRAILKLIFKLLGKDLPTWVDDLLQFLDEIKDAVLDLIHVLLGGDSESFSKSLHHAEVAFYEQLAAVEKLQQSYSRKTHDNKD